MTIDLLIITHENILNIIVTLTTTSIPPSILVDEVLHFIHDSVKIKIGDLLKEEIYYLTEMI